MLELARGAPRALSLIQFMRANLHLRLDLAVVSQGPETTSNEFLILRVEAVSTEVFQRAVVGRERRICLRDDGLGSLRNS